MKSIKILSLMAVSVLFICSCTEKKQENELEINVVDPNEAMQSGNGLNVKVVNELDPICHMSTADHLKDTVSYQGKTYGFCSSMCKESFLKNPEEHIHE